jgi:transposase
MNELKFKTKNYSLQDLADEYGVALSTFRKWISPIHNKLLSKSRVNKKRLRTLNNEQVQNIFEYLGDP